MKPRVYVEMSVVSYLDARLSRDVVILGNQVVAREWRRDAEERFELVVCGLVFEDAGDGDPQAVRDWLAPGRPRHLPLNAKRGPYSHGSRLRKSAESPTARIGCVSSDAVPEWYSVSVSSSAALSTRSRFRNFLRALCHQRTATHRPDVDSGSGVTVEISGCNAG